jgi:N-acetylmuramoyl-L-alanine amidase
VAYNDELAQSLAAALTEGKAFRVLLTRAAGKELKVSADGASFLAESERKSWAENPRLYERPAIANRVRPAAIISLHHDSTLEKYQEKVAKACGGRGGKRLTQSFKEKGYRAGFSVFVYKGGDPVRYQASLKIARAIGQAFLAMGRPLSNYHADKSDGETAEPIEIENGIYHKNLAVLRASNVPAVLVEAGLIVDVADEKAINSPKFRRAAAKALRGALGASLPR